MIIVMIMIIRMMMIIIIIMIFILMMLTMMLGTSQKIFKEFNLNFKIKQLKLRVTDFERWEKCEKQKQKGK